MKIIWVNCLHFYQPPWQDPATVEQVSRESYQWLLELFLKHKNFHASVNIAGTLLETLEASGDAFFIPTVRTLLKRKQIELTGTSYSHAFLPRLPEHEAHRQIELQEKISHRLFPGYKPRGFFLPELAYTNTVGAYIKKRGYRWIILDPISTSKKVTPAVRYQSSIGLDVVFRNGKISRSYPPETLFHELKKKTEEKTIITATDAELYGHFHKDWQHHLPSILKNTRLTTQTITDHLRNLSTTEPIHLRAASWQTKHHEIVAKNPFTIWYNKANPIHTGLWKLATTAMRHVKNNPRDPNFLWARKHLDRGLASCSWWWASEIKTSPFAPVGWSPDEIEKGARELIKSIRSLTNLSSQEKIRAEKIYLNLLSQVWSHHWKKYGS